MRRTRRTSQVGEVLRNDISMLLRDEFPTPPNQMMSVTEVEVSPDLRFARVHISSLADEATHTDYIAELNKAKRRLRHQLADRITLRYTPELDFRLDRTSDRAAGIERMLHELLPTEKKNDDRDESNDESDDQ